MNSTYEEVNTSKQVLTTCSEAGSTPAARTSCKPQEINKLGELKSECNKSATNWPQFRLVEFNPRRVARGAEGARVEVMWSDTVADSEWLWMSKSDIRENVRLFGAHPELRKALDAYAKGVA
jgi:hypothetical protein